MNGLQYIRNEFNMSIAALAKRMGVSYQAISQWEKNTRPIPPKRLEELSTLFDIPSQYFAEIGTDELQTLERIVCNIKNNGEDSYWFSQHEAALQNERNIISKIDYHLKGKGKSFESFEEATAYIETETKAFDRFVTAASNDDLRSILHLLIGAFACVGEKQSRVDLITALEAEIIKRLESIKENAEMEVLRDEKLF